MAKEATEKLNNEVERLKGLNIQEEFKSQLEKYHAETHHWITFHKSSDTDNVDTIHIGAAGVSYNIRKGERVLLPQSAINCLKYAVREGLDYGHPVEVNGRKYLRRIRESEYSYTIEGTATPEEAAKWRAAQRKNEHPDGDLVPQDGGQDNLVAMDTL